MSAWKLQQSLSGHGPMNYCLNVTGAVAVAGRLRPMKTKRTVATSQKHRRGLRDKIKDLKVLISEPKLLRRCFTIPFTSGTRVNY